MTAADLTTDEPSTTGTRPGADLLDPALYQRNPHELWTWMRANEPVYRDERNGLWGITRHADVMDVERRSSVFVSGQGYRAIWSPEEVNMIAQDDPRHRQQRMLVAHQFTRAAVAERESEIRALVTELVDAAIDRGELEVVHDLAAQLPARLTCRLLGFAEERWPDLKQWSERLMRTDMRDRDGTVFCEFIDANMDFVAAMQEVAPAKLGCPVDHHSDLLTVWLNARIDGAPLPPQAIVHETGLFIAGGAETTRTAISHGLRAFCDHPDQWELLASDPAVVPGAVDEVLRWVTPLNNFFRRAVADTTVGGQLIRRGDRVILLYPSANRDEAVFADPFRFDVTRRPNPHLAFGFGTHLCLGMNLAKVVLGVVFGEMARRVTDLAPLTEPDVEANIFARAVRSFRLGFRAR
jgi:cytochrome P450 family 142 subfamily A polypeptide 1